MNTKELIKKYWFVGVVGLVMVAFIVLYAVAGTADEEYTVSTLNNDGKDVIYTLNGENYYYADELYAVLKEAYGSSVASNAFYREVIDKAIADSEELSTTAYNWSQYIMANNSESDIDSAMKQSGYSGGIDDLTKYCLISLKQEKLIKELFMSDPETYIEPSVSEENPRKCWHILITVEDVEVSTDEDGNEVYTLNCTDEEQAKIDAVKQALADGTKTFEEIATEYSDDSTASDGGYLALVTESNKSTYVTPFADAVMSLEFGEVSEEVYTEYGCHFILVEEATYEELLDDSDFFSTIEDANSTALLQAIMNKAEEFGYVIYDEQLASDIDEALEEETEEDE